MKITSAAILSVALPLALAAQQPAGDPASPMAGVFRRNITNTSRNIAQAFDSIPESKYSFKPTPVQQSIGYVAQHLASDNYLFCNGFGAAKGTPAAADTTTADTVKATWPKEQLVTKLKASFAFCEEALKQLDDTKLSEMTPFSFRGPPRQIPRVTLVLGHITDMAEHYSQIAAYMRLNNMLPPTALPRPPRPSGD